MDRSVQGTQPLDKWQFERLGYFCTDSDSTDDKVRTPPDTPQEHYTYISLPSLYLTELYH